MAVSLITGRITGKQLTQLYRACNAAGVHIEDASRRATGKGPGFLTIDEANDLIWNLEHTDKDTTHGTRDDGLAALSSAGPNHRSGE